MWGPFNLLDMFGSLPNRASGTLIEIIYEVLKWILDPEHLKLIGMMLLGFVLTAVLVTALFLNFPPSALRGVLVSTATISGVWLSIYWQFYREDA